ncbi:MAG: cyclase family protein [Chloroflexi bacterium]|nr:cyclase family protein [Chloroflexota bacterium]
MARRIYDLSMPIDPAYHATHGAKIEYSDHREGPGRMAPMFGIRPEDMPEGMGSAVEVLTLRTHTGAHMDAPWHYYPTCGGEPARRIDELPLEWCMGDGVVLDFHEQPAGYAITAADLQAELARIGYELKPGAIVFIRTDAYNRFYESDYHKVNPGMSAEATRWLIGQGIRVMGIDAWSWDIPLHFQGEAFKRTGDKEVLWAAHRVGKDLEYYNLEQLGYLDQLPRSFGFTACVFPIKIKGAGGAWARAVAVFED